MEGSLEAVGGCHGGHMVQKRSMIALGSVFSSPFRQFPGDRAGSWKSGNAQKLVTSSWRNFNTIPCPARRNPEPEYARMKWLH
ncbi:hypothetical protein BD309DRAFT_953691 [Dichomitus squalens]|nr:hypothetical protein BD309DRAFT_953691 [Dichomitus squalens]